MEADLAGQAAGLMQGRLAEAVDYCMAHGLMLHYPGKGWVHAPFTLLPAPVDPEITGQLTALSWPVNKLIRRVAAEPAFLEETLAPLARQDPFISRLLALARQSSGPALNGRTSQNLFALIQRTDYFLIPREGLAPRPVQIEINTIAAGYAALSGLVNGLHRHLAQGTPWERKLAVNNPLDKVTRLFVEAFRLYSHPRGMVVMVVQPEEKNILDQRHLEFSLARQDIPLVRMTLDEIAAGGRLKDGHLWIGDRVAALVYFRAGYGPEDMTGGEAWKGRELIEESSAIAIPTAAAQLAGMKKIQQVLSGPNPQASNGVLARFVDERETRLLAETFAGNYSPEEEVETPQGRMPAWKMALTRPDGFVLKPQREGGGHNLFDEALVQALEGSTPASRAPYILMDRLRPVTHPSLMVRDGILQQGASATEIGRFGLLLAQGQRVVMNEDAGYLARTSLATSRESGVSAGFGHLDSLILQKHTP
ncbi:MAG: glutathione synthetase [Deltaproteobacteria bacterium]|nr:glutathione synthetase [Deltaproteobacteria bacterium]